MSTYVLKTVGYRCNFIQQLEQCVCAKSKRMCSPSHFEEIEVHSVVPLI